MSSKTGLRNYKRSRALFWALPVVLALLACQIIFCAEAIPGSIHGEVDFKAFYATGHLIVTGLGDHLYDSEAQRQAQNAVGGAPSCTLPFLYPAYAGLLFAPLAFVSYQTAFYIFLGLNLLLLGLTTTILRAQLPQLRIYPPWLPAYLFLCAFPVSIALMQGQTSFVLLFLFSCCFALQRRRKNFLAGVVLSATLIKFQIALPVAILFICWRKWRLVFGFAAGFCVLTGVSILVAGPHAMVQYLHHLSSVFHATALEPNRAHSQYGMFPGDMPNLHGLMFRLTHNNRINLLLTLAASLSVMAWAICQRSVDKLAVALPAAMLISYHLQAYDLTLLLLPVSIVADEWWSHRRPTMAINGLAFLVLGLLAAPIAPLLLVNGRCNLMAVAAGGVLWLSRERVPAIAPPRD